MHEIYWHENTVELQRELALVTARSGAILQVRTICNAGGHQLPSGRETPTLLCKSVDENLSDNDDVDPYVVRSWQEGTPATRAAAFRKLLKTSFR